MTELYNPDKKVPSKVARVELVHTHTHKTFHLVSTVFYWKACSAARISLCFSKIVVN